MRLAIAIAACLLTTGAYADTYKREVPANKGGYIGGVGFFNKSTCTSTAMPRVRIDKEPKHGKLILKPSTGPVSKDKTICKGKTVNVVYVFYQPKKGYRGADEARISYSILKTPRDRGGSGADTYKITVK